MTAPTCHRIHFDDARRMTAVSSGSAALVVTSPPYPMIAMWDEHFQARDEGVRRALGRADGGAAFERMHAALDPVWREVERVLMPGGIACINIGDAVRSLDGAFALYPNHSRILSHLVALGFTPLPAILWRKQTNAPNKFMGSGMLPPGAYVTLEHEYILIVRKGRLREFKTGPEKRLRRESALFWEERNAWYSDVWTELKGSRQALDRGRPRRRSGAFPFELAYRLISMFSVKADTVVDPFAGTGTTLLAAAATARHSIGFEIEAGFAPEIAERAARLKSAADARVAERLRDHVDFVRERLAKGREIRHCNRIYGFPVVTRQETELFFAPVASVAAGGAGGFEVVYADPPAAGEWEPPSDPPAPRPRRKTQLPLFD